MLVRDKGGGVAEWTELSFNYPAGREAREPHREGCRLCTELFSVGQSWSDTVENQEVTQLWEIGLETMSGVMKRGGASAVVL
jgi:hypothetical protein